MDGHSKDIIALKEIQAEFKKLRTNILLILRIDNYSDTPREDEFKEWTNEAKTIINKLNEKCSNNKLFKNELNTEINELKSLVNVLEDELLKEGQKKNGRVIGLITQVSILTERVKFEKFIADLLTLPPQINKTSQQTETQQQKAPVIALFCSLVNESKLIPKYENESVQKYCEKICKEFKLTYSDRVRQNFNGSNTKLNRKKVTELILPIINKEASKKINEYLTNKDLPKQNLYG